MRLGTFFLPTQFGIPCINVLLLCTLLAVSACASAPYDPLERVEYERINDPLEPTNRAIFSFNTVIQAVIMRPLAIAYDSLPEGVRTAVGNFFTNLAEPRNIANALLQGDPKTAGTSLGRFVTNSSVGLGGLINITGSENHGPRDFGQTLALWSGGTGAHLELPFLGSFSVTAGIGFLVDGLYSIPKIQANRGGHNNLPLLIGINRGMIIYSDNLAAIDEIYRTSPDPYTSFRNIYQQRRRQFVFGNSYDLDNLQLD